MADQSTYPPATRTLPQSNALAEAEPTSIQDLFNRNPEGLSERSLDAIIMEMRTLRVRLESTGTIGRAPRVSRAKQRDTGPPVTDISDLLAGPPSPAEQPDDDAC